MKRNLPFVPLRENLPFVPLRGNAPLRAVLATALLCVFPLAAAAQTEVERTVPASPGGTVEIENVAGSVTVTGWDREEVEVTGTLGREVEELVVERDGATVEIVVELKRHGRGHSSADLEIRVPRGSDLDIKVVSADIRVDGVDGDLTFESVSGEIRADGSPRSVDAESVSGDVRIRTDGAEVEVKTVSGNVDVEGARGDLDIDSVSGRIEVQAEELERADLKVVSGRIELSASLARGATLDIECHSGGVELFLPASTSARFEVETWSGRIDNELGPPARKVGRYTPQQELEFTLGDGDARVRIKSFSGNVALRER